MNGHEEYIARYVAKVGLHREKLSTKVVQDLRSVNIFIIFGELSQTVLFAKTVYDYEVANDDCYNIVITWPGTRCFFSKADELWSLSSNQSFTELYSKSDGILNNSKFISILSRSLNEVFLTIKQAHEFSSFFKNFITDNFINKHKEIKVNLPSLVAKNNLPNFFFDKVINLPKKQLLLMPFTKSISFQYGKNNIINHYESLYVTLVKALLDNGYGIVCVSNDFTFDLSRSMDEKNVLFLKEPDFQKIITMCYMIGTYFDYFGNSSFIGHLAQSDSFNVVERNTWFEAKKIQEYDVYNSGNKIKNYFSFLNFNNPDNHTLNTYYFNNIISCLDQFFDERQGKIEKTVMKQKVVNLVNTAKMTSPKFFGKLLNLKGLKNA